jgi:hypothetical protein
VPAGRDRGGGGSRWRCLCDRVLAVRRSRPAPPAPACASRTGPRWSSASGCAWTVPISAPSPAGWRGSVCHSTLVTAAAGQGRCSRRHCFGAEFVHQERRHQPATARQHRTGLARRRRRPHRMITVTSRDAAARAPHVSGPVTDPMCRCSGSTACPDQAPADSLNVVASVVTRSQVRCSH